VLSLPHPSFLVIDPDDPVARVRRAYWVPAPLVVLVPRSFAALLSSLGRASFRVYTVLEPEPSPTGPRSSGWTPAMAHLPATLIVRARKQGL
jgi:hypothetical protein